MDLPDYTPMPRDERDALLADVEAGYVSREVAIRDYGLDPSALPKDG